MLKVRENNVINKIFEAFELIFKFCFLIYGIASFNSFTVNTRFISLMLVLTACTALITLVYRVINFRCFMHNKLFWLSLLFLFSYVISFLLNIKYANMNAIKTFLFMGMEFCLLLTTDERKEKKKKKHELKLILTSFNFYMFISSIASIVLFACGYSNITERNGQKVFSGFVWGRLWGVFTDPNYASVLAAMAIIISLYALKKYKKVSWRIFNVLNICLQLAYITFSDSRTGLVVLSLSLAVYFACYFASLDFHLNVPIKGIVCTVLALCISVFALFAVRTVNKTYNTIVVSIAQSKENNDKDNDTTSNKTGNTTSHITGNAISDTTGDKTDNKIAALELGREFDTQQDISNRRFALWGSALETIKLKPVFGVSFESLVDFVSDNLPETYLVNNDSGTFGNYHNMLFNVLVGQGIVGIILIMIMIIYAGISLIKVLYNAYDKEDYMLLVMIFALLIAALASAMFLSEVIYAISVNMMLFWYLLGIMLSYKEKKEEVQELS